ncbi:DNA repair protein RadC [bacterium]|nr:DNA repair protein RadC [FCB group bacterium]MBL7192090.1 DNA repair protein RadC [bacterium]
MNPAAAKFLNLLPENDVLILGRQGEAWTDKARFSTSDPVLLSPAYDIPSLESGLSELKDSYFSAIFCAWGLSRLLMEKELFRRIIDTLKPGGVFLAVEVENIPDDPGHSIFLNALQILYSAEIIPFDRLKAVLKRNGLSGIRSQRINHRDDSFTEKDIENISQILLKELPERHNDDADIIQRKIEESGIEIFPFTLISARKRSVKEKSDSRRRDTAKSLKKREHILQHIIELGPDKLSDEEILASALECDIKLAQKILVEFGGRAVLKDRDRKLLMKNLGVDDETFGRILALMEIGRRLFQPNPKEKRVIKSPEDAFQYLADMRYLKREHLRGLYLDIQGRLLFDEILSIGSLSQALVSPREVLTPALEYGATGLILAHNHLSGLAAPSDADEELTATVESAASLMKVDLWDHIIIAEDKYYSFNEKGKLKSEVYRGRKEK